MSNISASVGGTFTLLVSATQICLWHLSDLSDLLQPLHTSKTIPPKFQSYTSPNLIIALHCLLRDFLHF